jgi:prevent-host-death family protein
MMQWRLADAKNRLSEVVNRALHEGPQQVSRRDSSVVVISLQEYQRLTGKRTSFKRFLLDNSPSLEGLDLSRDKSPMREVDL